MAIEHPPLSRIPEVVNALRLLLGPRGRGADRDIIIRSRLSGLIFEEHRDFWKVDGPLALKMLNKSMQRLPSEAAALSLVIRGLGEMKARCHADLAQPLIDHFRLRHRRQTLISILNGIGKTRNKVRDPLWLNAVAVAQLMTSGAIDWNTFQQAYHRAGRAFDIDVGRDYGLLMIFHLVLAVDPTLLNDWIAARPNDRSLAAIGRVALERLTFAGNKLPASSLLKSRNPLLQCFAAAAIVFPIFRRETDWTIRNCWKSLVDGGIAPGDAIWMTGARLKEAIHARYRTESFVEAQTVRLHLLRSKPEAAFGGIRNAAAEMSSLEQQLKGASEHLAILLPGIETMLCELAECWPQEGMSDAQMSFLDNIFVFTPEMRHRLAAKLSHIDNRQKLFKDNIDQLRKFIGLTETTDAVFDQYFLPDAKTFRRIVMWAARSLILHYERDNRGAGRRTSELVENLASATVRLIDEPFAAARYPGRWESAMGRSACAASFAMTVVDQTPSERRSEVQRLSELAIKHAYALLTRAEAYSSVPLDQMAADAVHQFGLYEGFETIRAKWISSQALAPFARALAIWAAPDKVRKQRDLAISLFREVAQLPPYHGQERLQLGRLFTLLDTALASCWIHGATDLITELINLWREEIGQWSQLTEGRWGDAAQMIVTAVERPGPERDDFLADPLFAQTACRAIMTGTATAGGATNNNS